ncbi:MAG TPA: c-type cytochrome [Longimicrobiales bacterium]
MRQTETFEARGWRRTAGCTLLLILTGVCALHAQLLSSIGDPARGERLFKDKCTRCHGADAGGTTSAPALRKAGQPRQPLELAGLIWNHSPQMTAKARDLGVGRPVLTGAETGDVLAYLYSLNFVDAPGNAARGLVLLKEKKCVTCHTAGTPAPTDAPSLRDLARFGSSVAMLDAMWWHAADMQDEMRAQQLQRVTLNGDDMSHILTYLRSLAGSAQSAPTRLSGDAREGAKLFSVKGCNRCHAIYGYGGRIASDLGVRSLPRTPGAIAGLLWNHGSRMRQLMERYGVPLPNFTRDELTNLVAYLYFLGFSDPAGDAARGRALFLSRGCVRCHATRSDARALVGPDLSRSQAVLSPLEAARLMWDHAPKMESKLREYGLKWPQFQHNELSDLLAYLNSLPTASRR